MELMKLVEAIVFEVINMILISSYLVFNASIKESKQPQSFKVKLVINVNFFKDLK